MQDLTPYEHRDKDARAHAETVPPQALCRKGGRAVC